jgi:hypothetical protein
LTRRIGLLFGVLLSALFVIAGVLWSDADRNACMDWDGGLHVGYDDDARPISTTWTAFVKLLPQVIHGALQEPSTALIVLLICLAPFAFIALGALFAQPRSIGSLWIGLGLTVLAIGLMLSNPSIFHDCDRKMSGAIFVVVLLGLPVGFFGFAAGLVAGRFALHR